MLISNESLQIRDRDVTQLLPRLGIQAAALTHEVQYLQLRRPLAAATGIEARALRCAPANDADAALIAPMAPDDPRIRLFPRVKDHTGRCFNLAPRAVGGAPLAHVSDLR